MTTIIKYVAWNAMIIGALILSTIFNFNGMLFLLSIFFAFESFIYALTVFLQSNESIKTIILKSKDNLKVWKVPFEVIFVIIAFYLNQKFIGMCMMITLFAYIYLVALVKEWSDKAPSENNSNTTE